MIMTNRRVTERLHLSQALKFVLKKGQINICHNSKKRGITHISIEGWLAINNKRTKNVADFSPSKLKEGSSAAL